MIYLALQEIDTENKLEFTAHTNTGGAHFVFEMPDPSGLVARDFAFDHSTGRLVFELDDVLGRFYFDADWLEECIAELRETTQEAHEEGIAPPSHLAILKAKQMLEAAARLNLPEPAVYPADESAVAIMFKKGQAGILILCEADGGFACFSHIDRRNERARYSAVSSTPGAFVHEHLQKLAQL